MKRFISSPLLLSFTQIFGLGIGGWSQYQISGQIGMVIPLSLMVLVCFGHQYLLRKKDYLPKMPEGLKQYLKIAALWALLAVLGYGFLQLHRLEEIWIVLPILLGGVFVMDLVILLCTQEVVILICPPNPSALHEKNDSQAAP